ncbi:GNAT family N-acetyltransferase [Fertoebacter nigrum]|uniref:GNAT family N-acetyltransferase n=1 Tax=Fertoeibacter niger TaxID=2656921 RepID=A0A8X8GRN1_9RHOB|nr:GNAT family N-acetyltransferase [Fertoeibacter niger]NUB43074.1 GNAT family N-acetyltransferase [Fertoeibacter niger]
MTHDIRDATAADESAFRRLWAEYLAFYNVTLPHEVTAQTWARILDPASPLTARLAVVQGRVLGFALHHNHISTWGLGDDGYLEDLFLTADARGFGLGRALLDDLVAISRAKGWARLYWMTSETNHTARKLYDRYALADDHVRYRIRL